MADQNKPESAENFFNEILSPCELFAARSRSHKIPARGQKDFYPDETEEQRLRLQQSLDEHWNLISEERVERLGNLVKATWIPDDRIVELQTPAGKFWQTMGFSAEGKQYLLPEEALYLMECGSLLVFNQDLPLSIQDGYEMFLSADAVSLQQYQVFGHLKRLGYVVHRFDLSAEPSPYARQLNLPRQRDRGGWPLKRKRSPSPTPTCSRRKAAGESQAERMEEGEVAESDLPSSAEPQTPPPGPAGEGRTWWVMDAPEEDKRSPCASPSGRFRWNFSAISFPDLGSGRPGSVAPPDPSLLPGGVKVGLCDVASWMQRINLRKVRMSAREEQMERRRRRRDVNKDRQVQSCRNWAEYHELLARRQATRQGRPAHLWKGKVKPLHDPTQPIATDELLEKISVIKSTDLLEGASRLKGSEEWRICFNVYQPDSVADFKKSNPGKPYSRMCVCSFDGPVPDLRVIKQLAFQSGDVPVVYAVVDHGDISFYTFKDFELPRDVFP
ncbi:tRNA-splicing endonuclease subunit Sen54 [Cyprinodon tularosa]|uniref:tRNA-splicing endonuclease subunit Sen54 n=1 Tax=Cyprinodon tularosa TaxID=77115 RepID=UPI0018E1DCEC|nr:tRNA-splicing endonuclease subunit Sen54 [Cyprinodon tularosa]